MAGGASAGERELLLIFGVESAETELVNLCEVLSDFFRNWYFHLCSSRNSIM